MRKSWWHYTHPNMTPTTHPLRSLVILLKNHSFMNCQDLDIINTFWARCNGSSGPYNMATCISNDHTLSTIFRFMTAGATTIGLHSPCRGGIHFQFAPELSWISCWCCPTCKDLSMPPIYHSTHVEFHDLPTYVLVFLAIQIPQAATAILILISSHLWKQQF